MTKRTKKKTMTASGPQPAGADPRMPRSAVPTTAAPDVPGAPAAPTRGRAVETAAGDGGRRSSGALAYLEVTTVAMASATAGLPYGQFFTSRGYLLPVVAGAAAAALLAAVTSLRRWRTLVTTLTAVLGFAVLAAATTLRDTLDHGVPTLSTAKGLGNGLLHGWMRMLTVNLPADVSSDLLLTPAALTWLAAFVGTLLALRTRAVLAPLAPPLLALVAALLLTAPRVDGNVVLVAAFLLEILVITALRVVRLETSLMAVAAAATTAGDAAGAAGVDGTRDADAGATPGDAGSPPPGGRATTSRGVLGRLVFAAPIVLLVTAAGVTADRFIPVADGSDRFDPRTVVPLEYDIDDTLTPLVTLKSQLREQPARDLFSVRVKSTGGAKIDRIRTAALDTFDGALWTSSDSYLRTGRTLAGDPNLTDARRVELHVSVSDLSGPYVPTVGWPVRIGTDGLGFSADSGIVVNRSMSLRGMDYDLVGEVRPRDAGLNSAVPHLTEDTTRYTELPTGLPPEIQQKAAELTAKARQPYAKLVAIEEYLRTMPYSLQARPGHTYDALRRLFGSNPQDRVGYAEQFAAAFAVLARSQGFPTRVAVGYLLRSDNRQGNTYSVTTAEAHAWPEVYLTGYGWVSFEPTDVTRRSTSLPTPPTAQPGTEEKQDNPDESSTNVIVDPNLKKGPGARGRIIAATISGAVVLAGLLVLAPFLVALEKIRRRWRRRRRGGNATRVIGAWRDSTDRLVERGVDIPKSLTSWEVAVRAEQRLGPPAQVVGELAPLATAAVFAAHEPGDDDVRQAWELNRRLRRDLRRGRGFPRAVRAVFDPRPLTRRRRDNRRNRRAMKRLFSDEVRT